VIENWRYDPQQKSVILHLVNDSHKDVTAFNISILEKYADGSTAYTDGTPSDIHDHQMMEDMLGPTINTQMGVVSHGSGNGTLAAGTSRDYVDLVGKDVSGIDAVVDVVAYSDGTAQVQNNDRAFKNLVAARKGPLLAMQKVVEVIKGVLADPMVSSPIAEALRALRPLADAEQKNRPPEDPEFFQAMSLRNDVQNLEMAQQQKINEREWLTRYLEQQEKRIGLMRPHCELVTK
jgi:hypothetical protein